MKSYFKKNKKGKLFSKVDDGFSFAETVAVPAVAAGYDFEVAVIVVSFTSPPTHTKISAFPSSAVTVVLSASFWFASS